MPTLPFGEFLDALRDRDFGVGLHEYVAAGKLLEHWDLTSRDELRNSLAALIARRDDEVEEIRRLFDEFYPPRGPVLPPPPPPSPPRRFRLVQLAGSRALWAAAFALVVAGAMLTLTIQRLLREPVPGISGSPLRAPVALAAHPVPDRTTIASPLAESLAEPPVVVPDPPSRPDVRGLAGLGLAVFAIAAVPLWGRQMRAATRRWTTDAWQAALAALPGPFHGGFVIRDFVTRMPRADIEEAATILGRSFGTPSRSQRGGRLDVTRSLRATLRAGMQPHLIFRPRRSLQPILVLQDVSQSMAIHARRVDGLCRDLGRQGIALERWFFDGDIGQPSARRHGPAVPLETLLRNREEGPVMILGNGQGIAASLSSGDRGWIAALRQQSRRVWVNPVADPKLWPTALQRVPVPAVTLTRAGLLQAARWLTQDDRTAFRQVSRVPRVVTRGHVEQLRRLASLVPYPTVELLEALRQRFAPDVPETAVLHTVGRQAAGGNRPFRMPDEDIRALVAEMRSRQPALEVRVRTYLLRVLGDSEPPAGSAAHLRWQAALALQRMQLAEVQGGDASASVEALRALYAGPLWEEIRDMVDRQPPASTATQALRATVGAEKRTPAPPRFSEASGDAAVAPFRWRLPSLRVAGIASAAAALAVLAGLSSGTFAIASAHRPDAYALDYVDADAGSVGPGVLRVRMNTDDPDVPRVVRLYRGDTSVGEEVTLTGAEPVTVPLATGSGPAIYQVRAALPSGAQALSNTTWAPALLVVIDARPWAHVTMGSAEAGVAAFTQTTPFSIRLPPGTYELRLQNEGLTQPTTERIVVAPTGRRDFTFAMPGYDLDAVLQQLGIRRPPAAAK
jgi:hypothetical protein